MAISIEIFNSSSRKYLPKKKIISSLNKAFKGEKIRAAKVGVVLVDDKKIHELNREYLGHDYPTDVISFSLDEDKIDGEIYISVDTATRQANDYGVSLTNEILRLAVHGTLHLIGYDDDTDEKRKKMQKLEDKYI